MKLKLNKFYFSPIYFGMFLFFFSCDYIENTTFTAPVYQDSLESLFTKVPEWLVTVYDPVSGGFYDNVIMKHSGIYEPDLQSTAFALTMLSRINIVSLDSLSEDVVDGFIRFVRERYDPLLELYLDPQYSEEILKRERILARTQGMAIGIYRNLGVEEYPSPTPTGEKTPSYLKTFDDFRTWFNNQNWERVWTAFDRIAMNSTFIKQLPVARADSIVQFIQKYVEEFQDEDGLWGKGQPDEIRFSGAAKYGTFCMNMNIPMPQPDRIYDTVLKWYHQNKQLDFTAYSDCPICIPRNAIRLLEYVHPYISHDISAKDRQILSKRTFEMLRYYHQSDGGFMKNQLFSGFAPDDILLARDTVNLVSDMNGTHLAVTARHSLYTLISQPVPHIKASEKILNIFKK